MFGLSDHSDPVRMTNEWLQTNGRSSVLDAIPASKWRLNHSCATLITFFRPGSLRILYLSSISFKISPYKNGNNVRMIVCTKNHQFQEKGLISNSTCQALLYRIKIVRFI